jgi:arsenate reductase-like glutaredoxin family protein
MMSQLMLLNASSGTVDKQSGDKIKKQQAEIMHNIQKLIDKPILIQGENMEASMASASYRERVNVLESVGSRISNSKHSAA